MHVLRLSRLHGDQALKPGSHISATISNLKIKNITESVSVELSVKHNTQCLTDIPDNH